MALSQPIGIAADSSNESTYLVVCENGAVYATRNGGGTWVEVAPILNSHRETELETERTGGPRITPL